MTEREIFEKYANLSEDELSEKSNKNVYVTVIKRCRGEKKRDERKINEISEISECQEYEVKSKTGKIFVN